ncbi:MAG: hypothetical protein COB44_04200 [Idiomarina sp.]|jgi:uncharacterized BrkB/YihY/UPF0761 family membrane protein|nr:hypothetical protein K734_09150 [Idiomarina loihiensis GSL 199]PHQ91276.1 MAG: hypothetical protein COB44_04200 [Idiomarina sp.]
MLTNQNSGTDKAGQRNKLNMEIMTAFITVIVVLVLVTALYKIAPHREPGSSHLIPVTTGLLRKNWTMNSPMNN